MARKTQINPNITDIIEIQETIIAYANGDYRKRLKTNSKNQEINIILEGINMLGEELQEKTISKNYFQNIVNAVTDGIIVLDLDLKIKDVNEITCDIFQTSKRSILNVNAISVFKHSIIGFDQTVFDKIKKKRDPITCEYEISTSNHSKIYLKCTISRIFEINKKHVGYLIIITNNTIIKQQELISKKLVISTQESERKRLSYDIHDSLGQEINAVKMYLSSMEYMNKNSIEFKETLLESKHIINHSINLIREICFNLLPKSLESGSFLDATNELVNKYNKLCAIKFKFSNFEVKLTKERQVDIFRIIQEFINNSLKHSGCNCIDINIQHKKNKINIKLSNNGNAFNLNKVAKGNGLVNIFSRLDALEASYKFQSNLKDGTTLVMNIDNEES